MIPVKPFRTMKTVSANEAKQRFGAITAEVERTGEPIVVEYHGQPRVVIMPVGDIESIEAARLEERRRGNLTWYRNFLREAGERNADLSAEEKEALSVELGREVNRAIAERNDVEYDRGRKE